MLNMSFAITTKQVKSGAKTVTRRLGWWNLRPGTIINACEKCQGLKRGEKINVLRQIRVVSVRRELLRDITYQDCVREGFPEMTPVDFVALFMKVHKLTDIDTPVNRIEFEYVT